MKAKLKNRGLKATLAVVLVSLIAAAGFAASTAVASSQSQKSQATQSSDIWSHLGGDPLFPGGLTAIAQQQHISLRQAFVYAVTSSRGQTALAYAGLSRQERAAVTLAARMGMFHACSLRYGMRFSRMSFGVNGTSVDQNVTFLDQRYRGHPAAAFCMDVPIGSFGPVVHILVPVICVNIALINRTFTPKPTPVPGRVKIYIRKQAFSAATEEQLIFPTPTNVFRFKVQCGLKGTPRYIVYQSDPQPAGTCPVSAGRVLIWELSTLGPDHWQFLSPAYQTFNLKGKKIVLAVYKDKQVKQVTPPPTTTTVVTTTTPSPPTTTTTPSPVQHRCTLVVALASKSDPYTATASVGCDTTPTSVTIRWGDGSSPSVGPEGASHTYAVPPASSTPGAGVTYTVSATASFSNGTSTDSNQVPFFVPAPPMQQQTTTSSTTTSSTTTSATTTTSTTTTNPGPPPLP